MSQGPNGVDTHTDVAELGAHYAIDVPPVDPRLADIAKRCRQVDIKKRPSIAELLQEDVFKEGELREERKKEVFAFLDRLLA